MFFDPMYFVILAPGILLSLWASMKTKRAFGKYSKVRTMSGINGAQAAKMLLDGAGISDVEIKPHRGKLTDHYNPLTKTLALSEPVYGQASISAVGVACHEAGHAIQHANGYKPLQLRSLLVKPASLGSNMSIWIIIAGAFMNQPGLIQIGIILFAVAVAFTLVTLPVEFDASRRAKKLATEYGIVAGPEREGVNKVLDAAALTYVASALTAILTLLYYVMRFAGGRD